MRLYVDLDGVMANFHRSACPVFGIAYPDKTALGFTWLYDQVDLSISDFMDRIEQQPQFWETIEPHAWLSHLLPILDAADSQWQILSSASTNPASWSGKAAWVERIFGTKYLQRLILIHGDKARMSVSDGVLIDDRNKWITGWMANGGLGAFHWQEYTDDHEEMWRPQLLMLKEYLAKFSV